MYTKANSSHYYGQLFGFITITHGVKQKNMFTLQVMEPQMEPQSFTTMPNWEHHNN